MHPTSNGKRKVVSKAVSMVALPKACLRGMPKRVEILEAGCTRVRSLTLRENEPTARP